jgi:hypothetical protein
MSGFSIWHWFIVLFIVVGYFVPLWRIVGKAGFHGALSLLALVPLVNVVMLWVFAFVRWPVERNAA